MRLQPDPDRLLNDGGIVFLLISPISFWEACDNDLCIEDPYPQLVHHGDLRNPLDIDSALVASLDFLALCALPIPQPFGSYS